MRRCYLLKTSDTVDYACKPEGVLFKFFVIILQENELTSKTLRHLIVLLLLIPVCFLFFALKQCWFELEEEGRKGLPRSL